MTNGDRLKCRTMNDYIKPVYRCSLCGRIIESYLRFDKPIMPEDADFPHYCPNCGADMREAFAVLLRNSEEAKRMQRRWEYGFQRWSNEKQDDGTTEYGACGYGMICDYCSDEDMGRPCVRAWNAWLRENGLAANYELQTFEDAWNGILTEDVKKDE